ncbi:hypothetical protein BZA77DRAFT_370663 [Pyronema omphalodes]|nr:hypothetical protein BZA77DRAFT_370663 [Pyronema omphalodes]
MALSGLDSLQSLSDALEKYLLTRSPAAKKYYDSIDRSNRKTRDDPEREIIKKRISGRRTEKAKWGAGCTTRYQSADEEFGHLRWERNETPHGSDSEPDEKEDDEQLRVLLGYVRPPEDDNYDDIPKLEYDEEDEEAEIYENYDSGNEGDDEDERHHKKGRWAVLCGMMEGLICAPETSTGSVTTAITPGAPNSTVLAPVQNVTAPQNSGIPSSSLPPAISPDFGSSLFSTGQNHDSTASQQSFPDDLNSQFGSIITRSEPGIPNPIPTFPPMENLTVPTCTTEIANHIPTLPSMENLGLPTSNTETGNPFSTFPSIEHVSVPAFPTETGNLISIFPAMENFNIPTYSTETANPIATFSTMQNLPHPIFATETVNPITTFSTVGSLPVATFATEIANRISNFPSLENPSPPTAAIEPSITTGTSFIPASTITLTENAPEPSAMSNTEIDFNASPSPVYSPTISINLSTALSAAQDPSCTTPQLLNPPQLFSSIRQETPLTLPSTPITTDATAATEVISTSIPVPRATILNPNLNTHPIPRRHRITPMRTLLTPNPYHSQAPTASTGEDRIRTGGPGTDAQEYDAEYLSGKRKRVDQDTEMEKIDVRPVKRINGGMQKDHQDERRPDDIASRRNLKRVRWDENVTMYEEDTKALKRINADMQESCEDLKKPDGVVSRENLKKRVRWDDDTGVYEESARAPKRINAGMKEIRQDETKPHVIASRVTPKRVRSDDNMKVDEADTTASMRLKPPRKEGGQGDSVKLAGIRSRGILKRKREEEVEEVGKNPIVRSMVDTRATKRPNLRGEESWGLLKMVVNTVRSGWRFVVGLKNRIWR